MVADLLRMVPDHAIAGVKHEHEHEHGYDTGASCTKGISRRQLRGFTFLPAMLETYKPLRPHLRSGRRS
jgi:hypothetical protein